MRNKMSKESENSLLELVDQLSDRVDAIVDGGYITQQSFYDIAHALGEVEGIIKHKKAQDTISEETANIVGIVLARNRELLINGLEILAILPVKGGADAD
jgi:hypothetical protein